MNADLAVDAAPRFHQRIAPRVLFFIALPLTIFLVVVVTVNSRRNFVNLRTSAERELQIMAVMNAQMIEDDNNNAAQAARILADSQSEGMFGNRRSVLSLMERVVLGDPTFNGVFNVYEPNADGQDDERDAALPAGALTETGRFVPYVYRTTPGGTALQLEQNVNMETSAYYQGVKDAYNESGEPKTVVTEPYIYEGTGQMLVEFSHAVEIENRFTGVAGVDVVLADIERELNRIANESDVDAYLISSEGRFIAASLEADHADDANAAEHQALRTRHVTVSEHGPVFERLRSDPSDANLLLEDDGPGTPRSYFASARVATGDWLLVLRRPESNVTAAIWSALQRQLALAGVALAIVVGALFVTSVGIGRRVRSAADAAGRVARGDLTNPVEPGRIRDETGYLLHAIRTMTENLDSLVGDVKRASIQLNSTSTNLTATSHEQSSLVGTFGAATSQVASATTEISATSADLARTMDEVGGAAGETAALAADSRQSLRTMDSTMHTLEQATASVVDKLETIHMRANEISGVVATVLNVADQANLLSVNAAIEANKVGEAGAGFRVVAREIRRLADQTAAATLDIEQTVTEMQTAVTAGVKEMATFTQHVGRTGEDVATVSGQMEQIIQRVDANAERFGQVMEGMRAQTSGAEQISVAMQDLQSSAASTSDAVREYSKAAEELRNAIALLKRSVESFHVSG